MKRNASEKERHRKERDGSRMTGDCAAPRKSSAYERGKNKITSKTSRREDDVSTSRKVVDQDIAGKKDKRPGIKSGKREMTIPDGRRKSSENENWNVNR